MDGKLGCLSFDVLIYGTGHFKHRNLILTYHFAKNGVWINHPFICPILQVIESDVVPHLSCHLRTRHWSFADNRFQLG